MFTFFKFTAFLYQFEHVNANPNLKLNERQLKNKQKLHLERLNRFTKGLLKRNSSPEGGNEPSEQVLRPKRTGVVAVTEERDCSRRKAEVEVQPLH